MKTIKNLMIAFAASAFVLGGCTDDKSEADSSRDQIKVSQDIITMPEAGGTAEVEVTSSGPWRVSGVCDWARPSAESGKSGDKITFTVDPNLTDAQREATFKIFTGSSVVPVNIISSPGSVLELLSAAEMTLDRTAGTIVLKTRTNIPELAYSFSDGGDKWVAFKERTSGLGGSVLLHFDVKKNVDYSPRTTKLTISGGGQDIPVTVMQKQVDTLGVKKTAYEIGVAAQTIELEMLTNVTYTVESSQTWVKQVETRAAETKKLTFAIEALPSDVPARGASISIQGAGFRDPIVVSILQKDPNAKTVQIPDPIFRKKLNEFGWIIALAGTECLLTDKGVAATQFTYNPGYYGQKMGSLAGIENFPNLEKISVPNNKLSEIDLSKLHKVTSLSANSQAVERVILGDNPITSLAFGYLGVYDIITWEEIASETFTVVSDNLESLNLNPSSTWDKDVLHTIDISGCPKLKTLAAKRKADVLKTIYLKTGQTVENMSYTAGAVISYK